MMIRRLSNYFFLYVHRSFKRYDVLLQAKFPICFLAWVFLILTGTAVPTLLGCVFYAFAKYILDWTDEAAGTFGAIAASAGLFVFFTGVERASDMEWERKENERHRKEHNINVKL